MNDDLSSETNSEPTSGVLLSDRLARSLDDVRAPGTLAPAAFVAGRRLRTRRRVVGVGGLGAAAATVLVVALSAGSGVTRASDPAATPPPTSAAPDQGGPVPLPPASGWWDMPSTEIVARLGPLLPDGVVVQELSPSERSPGEPDRGTVSGLLADADGASTFQVMTYAVDDRDVSCADAAFTSGLDGELYRPTTCRVLTDDDGETIGRLTADVATTEGGTTIREVTVRQGKGFVYLLSTSTDYPKMDTTTPASVDRPPLTLAELRDIALSPSWTTWTPAGDGD